MSHAAKLGSDWNKHHGNLGYTPRTCRVLQNEFPFGLGIERGNTQGNELPYCPFDVRRLTGCDKPRRQPRNLDTAILKLDKGPERKCRSEEHTSELQSLMRISYAVFCLKKKRHKKK